MTTTIEHPPPHLSFRRLSSTDTRTFLYVNDSPVLETHRTYETKHPDPSDFWALMWGEPARVMFWYMWDQDNAEGTITQIALLVKPKHETKWSVLDTIDQMPLLENAEVLDLLDKSTHFRIA